MTTVTSSDQTDRLLAQVHEAQRELERAQDIVEDALLRRNVAIMRARQSGVPEALLRASTSLAPAALELALVRAEILSEDSRTIPVP